MGGRGSAARSAPMRMLRTRAALWLAFVLVHVVLAVLNLVAPGRPLGDVTGVYLHWAESATAGWSRIGIDTPWVYPILAFAPMTLALAFGPAWYGVTWLVLVSVLDGIAFAVLLGRGRLARSRSRAAWWWLAFLLALGPIALGRIDAVTVPFALAGLLWALPRPRVSAVLLTIGAWMKVWPGALLLAVVIAVRARRDVVTVVLALSTGIVAVSLLAGSGLNVFGFVAEQAGRGVQVESPLAVPWLWMLALGATGPFVYYDREMLTFQVDGAGTAAVAALAAPLMLAGVGAVALLGVRAVRHGASAAVLLTPLALGFTSALLLGNQVGSPQFATWLAAPIAAGIVLRANRMTVPAAAGIAVAACTQFVFPYLYAWLLAANPAFVLVLTLKVTGIVVLFAWAAATLWKAGGRPAGRTEGGADARGILGGALGDGSG